MGAYGRVTVECEFIGKDDEEIQKKNKSLHSFFLKKRRELRKRIEDSAEASSDGELFGAAWLLNGDIVDGPSWQRLYCDDCAGPNSDFTPFLQALEKSFPEVSYVIKAESWQSTVDSTVRGNVLFRRALESSLFPGEILSTRIPCGGGKVFFRGIDSRDAELVGGISSIFDEYRRAHAPAHPQIDEWTWLAEEMGDRWYRGFQTRFSVPGTADAVGEVLASVSESFPEIEIYGRIDTPGSLVVDGELDGGLGTEVVSCGVSRRCYWSPSGFGSIGWNEDGAVGCTDAFASYADELTADLLSRLPGAFEVVGRGAKLRAQMSVGDRVFLHMNIDSRAAEVGPYALNNGFCEFVGGGFGDDPSFDVAVKREDGKALGKMALTREDGYAIALNIGRLSAKVASVEPFSIELECVSINERCDIAPLLVFKKSNKLVSV